MKNAHPHTGKWLREWFPEQTKSVPAILIWTAVFLLDVVLVMMAAWLLGLKLTAIPIKLAVSAVLAVAFLLFWAQTAVYNRLAAKYRKTLE